MLLRCYSIFDRKALVYHAPFYAQTDGVAVRTLADVVGDPNTNFGRHPEDYVLFYVGTFDDSKGAYQVVSPLEHVIDAIALVKAMQHEIPFPAGTTSRQDQVVRSNGEDQ